MPAFLFQLALPEFTEDMEKTIPAHREHIGRLFSDGHVLSYSVSDMRDMIWCVISAEDETEAVGYIADFPLFSFFCSTRCFPLLFHSNIPAKLPGLSLN